MTERSFFDDDAKAKVRGAVHTIERGSAAEVVVAIRRSSDTYRDIDYLVGFAVALGALALLLFLPQPFAIETMPIDVALAFGLAAALSAHTPAIRRLLVPRARKDDAVERAARAAFYDLGIGRTRRRTGMLVYASLLERRVEVVADVGAVPARLGQPCDKATLKLRRILEEGLELDVFLAALAELGRELGEALPREDDDENELPNEVVTDEVEEERREEAVTQ